MKMIPLEGRGNEYLYLPDGSTIIWVNRAKKGFKRLQRSLFTSNTIEAREKRDEIFLDHFGEGKKISKKLKLLNADHWPSWEKTKARKSEGTRDSIKYSGQHLLPHIGGLYPEDLNLEWWENTYIPAKKLEKKDRKFFNEWKWLTSFVLYLHRAGAIERLPKFENPDPDTEEGLNLDDSEMKALYANATTDLKLQLDLGFKHFMRRSEVLLLPYSEIDFKKGVIELPAVRTKIRKARTIPLSDAVLTQLKARNESSGSPYVFPSRTNKMKPTGRMGNNKAWKNAIYKANKDGLTINPDATFHDLRHSGLSRAFLATNRYAEICVVAGLSLVEAQRTYLHFKPDQTRFVSALVEIKNTELVNNDNL